MGTYYRKNDTKNRRRNDYQIDLRFNTLFALVLEVDAVGIKIILRRVTTS